MKFISYPISGQHLYLKLAVFLTGLAIGVDSSLRQLLIQLILILVILGFEPSLYRLFLNSLKRLLPFFAGYWFLQLFLLKIFNHCVLQYTNTIFDCSYSLCSGKC
jgi:hypothetical protein